MRESLVNGRFEKGTWTWDYYNAFYSYPVKWRLEVHSTSLTCLSSHRQRDLETDRMAGISHGWMFCRDKAFNVRGKYTIWLSLLESKNERTGKEIWCSSESKRGDFCCSINGSLQLEPFLLTQGIIRKGLEGIWIFYS